MNSRLVKEFGSVLSAHVLPAEAEQRDCPAVLFPVILLLRMLLGGHLSVFYKTAWDADDCSTHYTDILVYGAASEYRKASFKKIASAHVDTAISLSWKVQCDDSLGAEDYRSCGVIRDLNIATPLGGTAVDATQAVLLLLQLAASTNGDHELLVEAVQEGVVGLKLQRYNAGAAETIDIGLLHSSTAEFRCNRFFENRGDCAFELQ